MINETYLQPLGESKNTIYRVLHLKKWTFLYQL